MLDASTPKNEKPVADSTTSGENILKYAAQNKKQRLLGILQSGAKKAISEDHLRKMKRAANMVKKKLKLDKPEPSNTTLYEVNFQTSSYSVFDRAHSDYMVIEDTGPKFAENFTPGEALDNYHKDPDAEEMSFYDCKREFMEKTKNGITIVHELQPTYYDEEDDYRNYDDTPLTRADREPSASRFFAESTSDSNSSIHIPSRKYSVRVRERNFESDRPKKSAPARSPRFKSGNRRKSPTQIFRAQSSSSSCHSFRSPHRRKSVTFDWTFNQHTPIERAR
ncbi:hypothetical protein JYU34_016602 [Plutella xylostella]|uniref:Uncharacterized protein n=1 Tax=Plutella xylostella TaxID=51655 RepID=A0ABQ7Q316_PLUXY|nr:hypothetical protein JYU34_016602 [Plutella xylostella]